MDIDNQLQAIHFVLFVLFQFSLVFKLLTFYRYKTSTWKYLYLIYFPKMHILQSRDEQSGTVKKLNNGLTAALLIVILIYVITNQINDIS
jgi:hypothetical protein